MLFLLYRVEDVLNFNQKKNNEIKQELNLVVVNTDSYI